MRLEDLFCNYVKPESKIQPENIAKEVRRAYRGHLAAEAEKYCCDIDALDRVLGGPEAFISRAETCYEYAVNGQLKTSDNNAHSDDWLDFASFINQARWDEEFHGTDSIAPTLEHIFKLAAIRARLDCDIHGDQAYDALPEVLLDNATGFLTLPEVAFLARMTEKAVRNATQQSASDRLVTCKQGSRTVVSSKEAMRWLSARRNFVPTQFV